MFSKKQIYANTSMEQYSFLSPWARAPYLGTALLLRAPDETLAPGQPWPVHTKEHRSGICIQIAHSLSAQLECSHLKKQCNLANELLGMRVTVEAGLLRQAFMTSIKKLESDTCTGYILAGNSAYVHPLAKSAASCKKCLRARNNL
eukprot:1144923-Pelagomonas_calceolata.AAC.10